MEITFQQISNDTSYILNSYKPLSLSSIIIFNPTHDTKSSYNKKSSESQYELGSQKMSNSNTLDHMTIN